MPAFCAEPTVPPRIAAGNHGQMISKQRAPQGLAVAAPKKPNFKDKEGNEYKSWISFAKGLPEKRAKEFEVMNAALSEIKSNIGDEIHFMQLTEYPEKLYAVERQRETKSKEGAYTHCKLKLRKPKKDAT